MKSGILSAASLSILICGIAFAQNADEPDRRPRAGQDRQVDAQQRRGVAANPQNRGNVAELAGWLATGNQAEIELGKLAAERTQNDQVKQFAQRMVEDHGTFLNELRKFMPNVETKDAAEPATADRAADDTNAQPAPPADREARRQARGEAADPTKAQAARRGHGEMMQIGLKASKFKLALTKQMLEEYQGQDFDMGYLGQQIVAHIDMLATLKAMQGHGTGEFEQLLERGIATTEGHLKQARALAMQLEDKEGGTASPPRNNATRP